tara:strand:- start:1537 stop:2664 length:1128 start_codon:yes stop_codon:yes gene_type:complete
MKYLDIDFDIFVFIMSSSIGNLFKLTTFGESHGPAFGGVIDGCPAGLNIDLDQINIKLNQRRPGTSNIYSQRKELDKVEFLSGIFEGVTLGTPIGFFSRNNDANSNDYKNIKNIYRPSHADFVYEKKYGIRDYRGGGRSSARETLNWVVAGAIASQVLKELGIKVFSFTSSVGGVDIPGSFYDLDLDSIYKNDTRCPCPVTQIKINKLIQKCAKNGDSVGGCVSTIIQGVPFGLGEPVFDKFNAAISRGIMSINASKGVSFGSGFNSSTKTGSSENDIFILNSDLITTSSNNSGGVQGGITNGQDIVFHAAFKPVSTIKKKQKSVNKELQEVEMLVSGRHDPCVVPRAVVVVQSIASMIILDYYLLSKTKKISDL